MTEQADRDICRDEYKIISVMDRGRELEFQLGLRNAFFQRVSDPLLISGWRSLVRHRWGILFVYLGVVILWLVLLGR